MMLDTQPNFAAAVKPPFRPRIHMKSSLAGTAKPRQIGQYRVSIGIIEIENPDICRTPRKQKFAGFINQPAHAATPAAALPLVDLMTLAMPGAASIICCVCCCSCRPLRFCATMSGVAIQRAGTP